METISRQKGIVDMLLKELWNADIEKAYDLFMEFPSCDNGFENIAYGKSLEEFRDLVEIKRLNSVGKALPEGFVPDTVFILMNDDGDYVGVFNFRHVLNSFLASGPGHIGYGISPRFRGRGYATEGLKLLVRNVSKLIDENEFYLSCDKNNPASLKVQKNAGGRVHHESDTQYFVRIPKYQFRTIL